MLATMTVPAGGAAAPDVLGALELLLFTP